MSNKDLVGALVLGGTLVLLLGLIFAPRPVKIDYAPVELPGSTLSVAPERIEDGRVPFSATLQKPGFVTVHGSLGGAPGPILGVSSLLPSGTVTQQVPVSSPLEGDRDYVALLFMDDGDGIYEAGVDLPVTSDGKSVRADFTIPMTGPQPSM